MNRDQSRPRRPRYQDYVIRGDEFIGEFEEMYQHFADPWKQTEREANATDKLIAIQLLQSFGASRVIELGCGLGGFSAQLASAGMVVRGVDISTEAIARARRRHAGIDFQMGDVLDFDLYRSFRPDAIIMAEITWYVLDRLDELRAFLRNEMRGKLFLHLLHTYAPGVQRYGTEFFHDLPGILRYFDMEYLEWGSVAKPEYEGGARTFFLARL